MLPKSSEMYTAEKSKHGLVNLAARVIIMVIKADSSAGGVNFRRYHFDITIVVGVRQVGCTKEKGPANP